MENFLLYPCLMIKLMETKESSGKVLNDGVTIIVYKLIKL